MNPVRLQFEPARPGIRSLMLGRRRSPVTRGCVVVLAAALALAATVAWEAIALEHELTAVRQELQVLQRRGRDKGAVDPSRAQIPTAQRQAWNQLARQLNTPWPALLDTLEAQTPETVALVSIEPDARRGSVRLQAEARNLDTLLIYAQQLGAGGAFDSVMLLKHETNDQDANKPLRLSLELRLAGGVR